MQPRRAEQIEGQEGNLADAANAEEGEGGGLLIELEVNLNGEGEEDIGDEAAQLEGNNQAGGNGQAAGGDNGEDGGQAANTHVHRLLGDQGDRIVEGTSTIGQTIFGALAFPAVAAGMGNLFKLALPASWIGPANTMNGRPGIFRTQWGRSVVGGALFVVLKDALVLYCRWRLAQSHRQRRIMDYDRKTKKYSV